ncbi:MAG: hypothetical protein ABIH34_00455 [Nanoarchaeota archaeon]
MKRAQAAGAAALIAMIAVFIVLYILFLPAEERAALLDEDFDDDDSNDDDIDEIKINRTLIKESPGLLDDLSTDEFEHDLPSITLFASTSASMIKEVGSIYAKNGVFDKNDARITFLIDDLANTNNVLLSFVAEKRKGMLTITLNGEQIFAGELSQANAPPISIQRSMLRDNNELRFSVSSVGWMFWRTNEYELRNLLITSDITDVSGQESKNVFLISAIEKENLDEAKIRFVPECEGDAGRLRVSINNKEIFNAIPDCGSPIVQEFSPGYLSQGENRVVFSTDKGRVIIDRIQVHTDLRELKFPTYYFDLSEKDVDEIASGDKTINMTFRFIEDEEQKKADIFVNGHRTQLFTYERFWSRNLDNFVEPDSNGIKIEPDGTLELVEFKVILYDRE